MSTEVRWEKSSELLRMALDPNRLSRREKHAK